MQALTLIQVALAGLPVLALIASRISHGRAVTPSTFLVIWVSGWVLIGSFDFYNDYQVSLRTYAALLMGIGGAVAGAVAPQSAVRRSMGERLVRREGACHVVLGIATAFFAVTLPILLVRGGTVWLTISSDNYADLLLDPDSAFLVQRVYGSRHSRMLFYILSRAASLLIVTMLPALLLVNRRRWKFLAGVAVLLLSCLFHGGRVPMYYLGLLVITGLYFLRVGEQTASLSARVLAVTATASIALPAIWSMTQLRHPGDFSGQYAVRSFVKYHTLGPMLLDAEMLDRASWLNQHGYWCGRAMMSGFESLANFTIIRRLIPGYVSEGEMLCSYLGEGRVLGANLSANAFYTTFYLCLLDGGLLGIFLIPAIGTYLLNRSYLRFVVEKDYFHGILISFGLIVGVQWMFMPLQVFAHYAVVVLVLCWIGSPIGENGLMRNWLGLRAYEWLGPTRDVLGSHVLKEEVARPGSVRRSLRARTKWATAAAALGADTAGGGLLRAEKRKRR